MKPVNRFVNYLQTLGKTDTIISNTQLLGSNVGNGMIKG
jgi:hypothetical protein